MKKSDILKIVSMCVLCQFIVSCATTVTPTAGSEKIKIIGTAKNKCKRLGEINTNEVKEESFDSEDVLHNMNVTLLKNKALALGANVMVITDHSTTTKEKDIRIGKVTNRKMKVNTHVMTAIAYYCSK